MKQIISNTRTAQTAASAVYARQVLREQLRQEAAAQAQPAGAAEKGES